MPVLDTMRSGGRGRGILMMLVMSPVRLLRWLWVQMTGAVRNLWGIVTSFSFDQVLPSGMTDLILEVANKVAYAAGRGSPRRGVFAGITLVLLGIVTAISGLGLVGILLGGLLISFNVARTIPAVNKAWRGSAPRKAVKRDRDIPLFRNE